MKISKTATALLMFLTLSACATMNKMVEPEGMSATECFTEGGVIDNSGESAMCNMGEDKSMPII